MPGPELSAIAQNMIVAVRAYVDRAMLDVIKRVDAVESLLLNMPLGPQGERGEKGDQGERGEPGESIKGEKGDPGERGLPGESIRGEKGDQGERGEPGIPGVSIRGEKGDPGERGEPGESIRGEIGPPGRDGKDGASVHPDTVAMMLRDAVDKAVAALPLPKDGRDGKDGAPGRDAAELVPLPYIDETRSYPMGTWATYNGGEIRAARVTDPVQDGRILDAGWTVMREGISALVVTQGDDPRELTVAAMLTSGTKALTSLRVPVMIYREVWREGEYEQGDVVTYSGSAWHCQQTTGDKPGTSSAWKLMVKHGAAGKDAATGGGTMSAMREPVRLK